MIVFQSVFDIVFLWCRPNHIFLWWPVVDRHRYGVEEGAAYLGDFDDGFGSHGTRRLVRASLPLRAARLHGNAVPPAHSRLGGVARYRRLAAR